MVKWLGRINASTASMLLSQPLIHYDTNFDNENK